jgi:hypothetical protein
VNINDDEIIVLGYLRNARRIAKILGYTSLVGFLFVVIATGAVDYRQWGAITLWGLGAFALMAVVGFLFGVPQIGRTDGTTTGSQSGTSSPTASSGTGVPGVTTSGERTDTEAEPAPSRVADGAYHFVANNSVQQISDWLTKIIVGLGLVELKNVPAYSVRLGDWIARSAEQDGVTEQSLASIGIGTVIYFGASGFLAAYLFMRLCVQGLIARVEGQLSTASAMGEFLERVRQAELAAQLLTSKAQKIADNKAGIAQTATASDMRTFMDLLPVAATIGAAVLPTILSSSKARRDRRDRNDPHKGAFGGSPTSNGRKLSAKVTKTSDKDLFDILLTVESTDSTRPLVGSVKFYLHPSFAREIIDRPVEANGTATLPLVAWGAFTVGVRADDGRTELELDLASLEDAPERFRSR